MSNKVCSDLVMWFVRPAVWRPSIQSLRHIGLGITRDERERLWRTDQGERIAKLALEIRWLSECRDVALAAKMAV